MLKLTFLLQSHIAIIKLSFESDDSSVTILARHFQGSIINYYANSGKGDASTQKIRCYNLNNIK